MASGWLMLILGLTTAINIAIIKFKYEQDRTSDATLDLIILFMFGYVLGNSMTGLAVATIASAFISVYLYFSPPDKLIQKFSSKNKKKKKRRAN